MPKLEINLSEEDLKNLIKALKTYLSDLGMEIADTDGMDFWESLKSERTSIQNMLNQLKSE